MLNFVAISCIFVRLFPRSNRLFAARSVIGEPKGNGTSFARDGGMSRQATVEDLTVDFLVPACLASRYRARLVAVSASEAELRLSFCPSMFRSGDLTACPAEISLVVAVPSVAAAYSRSRARTATAPRSGTSRSRYRRRRRPRAVAQRLSRRKAGGRTRGLRGARRSPARSPRAGRRRLAPLAEAERQLSGRTAPEARAW